MPCKKKVMLSLQTPLKGFTLAEVLITLAIIGIIAAMTIPSLTSSTNDLESKTALKNAFSFLNDSLLSITNDHDGTIKNVFPGDGLGSELFKEAFASKLNVTKNCSGTAATFGGTGNGAQADGCWHALNKWYNYNGVARSAAWNNPGLILANGYLVSIGMDKTDCSKADGTYTRCGGVIVDVNGFKGPNTIGKDIFAFSVLENRVIPEGVLGFNDPATTCVAGSTDVNNTGSGCAGKFLYDL